MTCLARDGASSTPTTFVCVNGLRVTRSVGACSKEDLKVAGTKDRAYQIGKAEEGLDGALAQAHAKVEEHLGVGGVEALIAEHLGNGRRQKL
jgi:hypothetical protein